MIEQRRIALFGASGSIGRQTVSVIRAHPHLFKLVAASVHNDIEYAQELAAEFELEAVGITNPDLAANIGADAFPSTTRISIGQAVWGDILALNQLTDVVVAVVGAAGIDVVYEGLRAKKRVLCANKEALVAAGDLIMDLATPHTLIPIDSEHSAIFQCLQGENRARLQKIWLTCSGGPFFGKRATQLRNVSAKEALAHPTWKMGPKITIDCATLANKGLEVIEAHHLFGTAYDDICVLIHPQSKIHSMVEFVDGSTMAQIGPSDMRIPIQYALSYPERIASEVQPLSFYDLASFDFYPPDTQAFPCLDLAISAGRVGGTMPCIFNAANEVANAAFRDARIGFFDISATIQVVMEHESAAPVESIEQLKSVDARARVRAQRYIKELSA